MHLRTVWATSEVKSYRLTLSTMSQQTSQLWSKCGIQKKKNFLKNPIFKQKSANPPAGLFEERKT